MDLRVGAMPNKGLVELGMFEKVYTYFHPKTLFHLNMHFYSPFI
jgi:hypothetical protein